MEPTVVSPACGRCGGVDLIPSKDYYPVADEEGYYCKNCVTELTTPPRVAAKTDVEPLYITQMRHILKHGAAGITDEKGKKTMCDSFTASAVTQVWDKISEENRSKLRKLPMMRVIDLLGGHQVTISDLSDKQLMRLSVRTVTMCSRDGSGRYCALPAVACSGYCRINHKICDGLDVRSFDMPTLYVLWPSMYDCLRSIFQELRKRMKTPEGLSSLKHLFAGEHDQTRQEMAEFSGETS